MVLGLSILAVVLAVFAWPQGDEDASGPLNAIAAAAERTQREPGGRTAMHGTISSPEQSFTITGEGVYDAEDRSRAVLTTSPLESGDSMELEMIGAEAVIYMRSSTFGELPDGNEWMALDLSSFGQGMGDSPLPANGDARGELELLEAVTGDVQELGKEDVRGVPTTHYRGTVSVSENVERLREEGAEDVASYVEEKGAPLRVEVWIDAEGLVRRMRYVQSQPGDEGEGSMTMDMRVDFFDFGIEPEIDVPESSEVFDATSLAEDELEKSSG